MDFIGKSLATIGTNERFNKILWIFLHFCELDRYLLWQDVYFFEIIFTRGTNLTKLNVLP